jgi:L-seryl-tRNA(Ser) seleniumtransferase
MVELARSFVADERERLAGGHDPRPTTAIADELVAQVEAFSAGPLASDRASSAWRRTDSGWTPVINATGVLLHTNLGRAAWPDAAIEAARLAASEPSMLELDPSSGRRGRRFSAVEDEVERLTGAEAALVTNNNAAAVAIAVGLAGRGGVAVSRGELVEIGGGVRIPEIVRRAGARLVEVGTTNRTRVADFEAVLAEGRVRVVLRVHPSNFTQAGFVEAPDLAELAGVAHEHGAIVIDDLGSGALLDTAAFGLAHEPMPRERLEAGADVVTFSGDKLVGGPQAGILAGRRDVIEKLRRDPLARAMRPDKVILAALAATLRLYRAGVAHLDIPVWRQIATPVTDLEARARRLAEVTGLDAVGMESTIGGGSLPGQILPSWGVAIGGDAGAVLARLRAGTPAVIGRIASSRVLLDLRTVEPKDDERLAEAIRAALAG